MLSSPISRFLKGARKKWPQPTLVSTLSPRVRVEKVMIDQDYVELLNRAPPSAEVVEWTFPTNILAGGFAAVLLGTPALSLVLYLAGSEGHNLESDDVELRVRLDESQ